MADDDPSFFANDVAVILIAMGSAALVVTMYHLIAVCLCSHQVRGRNPDQPQPPPHQDILLAGTAPQTPSINETSLPSLIPAHKYYKKKIDDDVAGGDEDATCAVCLGDFEVGEELRTLPECAHSFHVPCIDMWLYSHPNCPVCRANATPSSSVLRPPPGLVSGESNARDHRIHIAPDALAHSGLVRG